MSNSCVALPGSGSHLRDYDFKLTYPATQRVKYAASSDCFELKAQLGLF